MLHVAVTFTKLTRTERYLGFKIIQTQSLIYLHLFRLKIYFTEFQDVCLFNAVAHQSVEHQRVVSVLVGRLHHDVEQGVQRVLQELWTRQNLRHSGTVAGVKTRHLDVCGALTLTISPPSTSISLCRICSRSSGLDLQFSRPRRSTGRQQGTNQTTGGGEAPPPSY